LACNIPEKYELKAKQAAAIGAANPNKKEIHPDKKPSFSE